MKNKEVNTKYVSWLLESAISSILLEQTEQLAPVAPTEPAPAPAPTPEAVPPADPNAAPAPQATMSLDDLIEKLNLIRGGRSFTDPEVYTKMGEVFKGFTDQQKVDLQTSLTKVIDVIVNPDEQAQPQQPGQAPQVPQSTTPQPPPASPTPQAGAPSASPIA